MLITVIGGSGSGKSAYAEALAVSLAGEGPLYYLATMQIYDEEGERKAERHRKLRAGKGFTTIEQPLDIADAAARIEAGSGTLLLECMSNLVANEMFSGAGKNQEELSDQQQGQTESSDKEQKECSDRKQEQVESSDREQKECSDKELEQIESSHKEQIESSDKEKEQIEFFGYEQKRDAENVEKIIGDIRNLTKVSKHLIVVTNNVFEDGIEYDAATVSYMEVLGRVNERLAAAADAVVEVVVGLPVPVKGAAVL
jgi:adenosylcobinamide kinase/adenosylcobinamide-phosphate guanylyltransferase